MDFACDFEYHHSDKNASVTEMAMYQTFNLGRLSGNVGSSPTGRTTMEMVDCDFYYNAIIIWA